MELSQSESKKAVKVAAVEEEGGFAVEVDREDV